MERCEEVHLTVGERTKLTLFRIPFRWAMLLWCVLLAVCITWPVPLYPYERSLGAADGDALKHLWTLWWVRQEVLGAHQLPMHTFASNFPYGLDLFPIEPLNGLAVVLLGFVPLVAASNLVGILNFIGIGLAGAHLGHTLCRNPFGGFVCGTVLQGSAMATFTLVSGVGELQHLWLLPLGLSLWIRLRRNHRLRDAVYLGLTLAGTAVSCLYYGFFLAMALLIVCSADLILSLIGKTLLRESPRFHAGEPPTQSPLKLFRLYAFAAAVATVTTLPVVGLFHASYPNDQTAQGTSILHYVFAVYGQPLVDPLSSRLAPVHLIVPRKMKNERQSNTASSREPPPTDAQPDPLVRNSPERRDKHSEQVTRNDGSPVKPTLREMNPPNNNVESADSTNTGPTHVYDGGRYLGLPLICLAAFGVYRRPREGIPLFCAAITTAVLACGSHFTADGVTNSVNGTSVMPFFYLNRLLERLVEPIHFPVRFLTVTVVALAGCAALAVTPRNRVFAAVAALVIIGDVHFNQLIQYPLPTVTPMPYPQLSQLPDDDAPTVDLSLVWRSNRETRSQAIAAQLQHGQKSQFVPIERLDEFNRAGHDFVANLPLIKGLEPASLGHTPRLDNVDSAGDLAKLYNAGFRRLQVLGTGQDQRISIALRRELQRLVGEPLVASPSVVVWSIPAPRNAAGQSETGGAGVAPNSQ